MGTNLILSHKGPCKVRNETEAKRNRSKLNETNRYETKQIETKRNQSKRNETNRNETNCMERKINIYSINQRTHQLVKKLSNSILELSNSSKESSN